MDRILFAESWQPRLAELGLRTFDDFYHLDNGTAIGANQKRNVQRLTLGEGPDRKVLFMKRFHHPHFKDMLSTVRTFGQFVSQAGVEWRNARHLLDHGIGTYRPACMGERTHWKMETHSFFITEQLEQTCLLDFVMDTWHALDRGAQDGIIIAMADLARRLHELNVAVPDLVLWHLYFYPDDTSGNYRFSIIDLHRMTQGVRSQRRKARDMSRLCWSMLPEYFDDDHRQLLLDAYLDGLGPSHAKALARVIERYAGILNKRHTAHRYYPNVEPAPA
jgi:hypothetical protein